MNNKIEQMIENIEHYVDNCNYSLLSKKEIVVNKDELKFLLSELKLVASHPLSYENNSSTMVMDNRENDGMLELITKKRTITSEDIVKARNYLSKIPCKDFVYVCGTGIGCSNCPHYHFKLVFEELVNNFIDNKQDK